MTTENYPGVSDRVKAILADSMVIIIFMFVAAYTFSIFNYVPDNARIIAFIFIFVLYDPIFTSLFGGTIGHFMIGLRVKREKNQMKNILFPMAIIRFFVKVLLGWISLLTVSGNKKRKAIHDYLVGSVVVYKSIEEERTNANMVLHN
jgi:uncharacterized RDD family membrane protein YckC